MNWFSEVKSHLTHSENENAILLLPSMLAGGSRGYLADLYCRTRPFIRTQETFALNQGFSGLICVFVLFIRIRRKYTSGVRASWFCSVLLETITENCFFFLLIAAYCTHRIAQTS